MATNKRILIIDDNRNIHEDYRKILVDSPHLAQRLGDFMDEVTLENSGTAYELTSAYQGQQGVDLAEQALTNGEPFAMAFVDMRMPPGLNGVETVKQLWKIDQQLQIVICTAYSDHTWQELQDELGRTDNLLILKKPFDNAEVRQIAVSLTEKRCLQLRLESALEQATIANTAKSHFVATMSHELRTPLNGLLGMTQLLAATDLTDQQKTYLNACRTSGESLLSVIGGILDFSKIEAGHLDLSLSTANLFDLLEGVTQSAGMDLLKTQRPVDLTCFVDPSIPSEVIADQGKLRQLMFNIVGNAVKFTEEGSIAVSAIANSVTESEVSITFNVCDTGIGIPDSRLANIFEPFKQADNSATRKYEGAGLGLSICSQFVKMMGGDTIEVETELGEGSQFSFTLTFDIPEHSDSLLPLHIQNDLVVGTVGLTRAVQQNIQAMLANSGATTAPIYIRRSSDPLPDLSNHDFLIVDYNDDPNLLRSTLARIAQCQVKSTLTIVPIATAGRELPKSELDCLELETVLVKPISQTQFLQTLKIANRKSATQQNGAGQQHQANLASEPKARESKLDRQIRVLLVEDNEINQIFAENLFQAADFQFATCSDGKEAVDLLQQDDNFDIILMDCHMPVMDGLEATSIITRMADEGQIKQIPIVALTANAVSTIKEDCLKAGMKDYLTKPFVIEDLHKVIDQCLEEAALVSG